MENKPFIDFQGKKVIVTGASCGIGRAIAEQLSQVGANLVLIGRDRGRLTEARALLQTGEHHILLMDLRDQSNIVPIITKFANQYGRIYGMCHAARVDETRPLSSSNVTTLYSILEMNLVAGIELSRGICRHDVMEESGGSILFLSSIAARVGIAGRVGYAASHGGISAAARSLAIELARRRIRVNTLSPGLVQKGMAPKVLSKLTATQIRNIENSHPLGIGQIQDVARVAAFLLAPQSSWITGQDLVVDGGYTAQ
jgi:NAD(P)-dependent dehydrogenase (short-subunit alcohol dehydrogenase family)